MPNPHAAPPKAAEAARNGLATKLGAGGAGALVTTAIVDAVATGHIDTDATRAALAAVVLAVVVMVGKYAQAVAAIIGAAIERRVGELVPGELRTVELAPGIVDRVLELEQTVANLKVAS